MGGGPNLIAQQMPDDSEPASAGEWKKLRGCAII